MVLALLRLQAMTGLLQAPEVQANEMTVAPSIVQSPRPAESTAEGGAPTVLLSNQPAQVQVNTPAVQLVIDDSGMVDRDQFLAEVDQLIVMLDTRKGELEAQIDELSLSLLDGNRYQHLGTGVSAESSLGEAVAAVLASSPVTASVVSAGPQPAPMSPAAIASSVELVLASGLADLDAPNRDLQSKIEELEATEREYHSTLESERSELARLEQRREIALATLRTVTSKVDELRVARAATGTVVKPIGESVASEVPVQGFSLVFAVGLALFVGFFLALIYVAWAELQRMSRAAE
jgi:hypothetical protein